MYVYLAASSPGSNRADTGSMSVGDNGGRGSFQVRAPLPLITPAIFSHPNRYNGEKNIHSHSLILYMKISIILHTYSTYMHR